MFATNKTIVISLAIIFIIVFYHIQFEYKLKNYNENFEKNIKKLSEELIKKHTNLKIENSNKRENVFHGELNISDQIKEKNVIKEYNPKYLEYDEDNRPWVAFLRIQRTGSTFITSSIKFLSHGCNCGWYECKCQSNSETPLIHGISCSAMSCVEECSKRGCRLMFYDPPHADYLDLQRAFMSARIKKRQVVLLTILRHPYHRFLSEYEKISQKLPCSKDFIVYAWDYHVSCNITLSEFVNDKNVLKRASNRMTKMIAGVSGLLVEELYDSEEDMLENAIKNLQELTWFGILEHLNESLFLFDSVASQIGLEIEISRKFNNTEKTVDSSNIDVLTNSKIASVNQLDLKLYSYALELFRKRISVVKQGLNSTIMTYTFSSISNNATIETAQCISGICDLELEVNESKNNSFQGLVEFGEVPDLDYISKRPQCETLRKKRMGSYKWYNQVSGCVFEYDWLRKTIYKLQQENLYFSTRSYFPFKNLIDGHYIVVFGAAQSMGIQSLDPFNAYLEYSLNMPTVTIGFGGIGAGFFVDLLESQETKFSQAVYRLVKGARVVIVQAMSGRSESNSVCPLSCNNMFCIDGRNSENVINSLPANIKAKALNESSIAWVRNHKALIEKVTNIRISSIHRTVVFLVVSQQSIRNKSDNEFPQFVTEDMTIQVRNSLPTKNKFEFISGIYVEAFLRNDDPLSKIPIKYDMCTTGGSKTSCRAPKGQLECSMHDLSILGCKCGYLGVKYYPTPLLQLTAGFKISLALSRDFGDFKSVSIPNFFGKFLNEKILKFYSFIPVFSSLSSYVSSLLSVCDLHIGSSFYLYFFNHFDKMPMLMGILKEKGCYAHWKKLHIETLFTGTPLEGWISRYNGYFVNKTPSLFLLSTLLRLVLHWRFGGWYIGPGSIVLRSLSNLTNSVIVEKPYNVQCSVSHFSKKHPFLESIMNAIKRGYPDSNMNFGNWTNSLTESQLLVEKIEFWMTNPCTGLTCVRMVSTFINCSDSY